MTNRPCIPDALPITDLNWRRLLPIVGRANAALARYDGMLQTLPNPAVLLSPMTANEAVLSSRIEGTQATLDEVLEFEAGIQNSDGRSSDLEEVSNYRIAVSIAESALDDRPLSLSLVKAVHQRLMQGVRGRDKEPGSFRREQNWIGRRGDPIERARFIPPSPLQLQDALEEWERYLQSSNEDPIVQTAVAHAQFEILHPFKDGNGRIGRILIPLLLHQKGSLSRPMFYVSEFLEAHRDEYYDALLSVTAGSGWDRWLEFFMEAVTSQAEANLGKVRAIRDLYEDMRKRFVEVTHSQFAMAAVDVFFMRPIISGPDFSRLAAFNNRITANGMLRQLEGAGLIKKLRTGVGRLAAVYAMPQLINIAEGRPVL